MASTSTARVPGTSVEPRAPWVPAGEPEPVMPVYVWEAPVRLWHWVMAACLVALAVTGYLIGSPLPSLAGDTSELFVMGYIRFVHFAAAYVFAIFFVLRLYWAFVGNRYARDIFRVPLSMLNPSWWRELIDEILYYLFLKDKRRASAGHDPLAAAAMFFMYVLGTVFMICTGFALYGEGKGMGSWQYTLFSSWIIPLLGQSQAVHTWHHMGMWYLVVFTMVHLYFVLREDVYSGQTVVSPMISGWRSDKR